MKPILHIVNYDATKYVKFQINTTAFPSKVKFFVKLRKANT